MADQTETEAMQKLLAGPSLHEVNGVPVIVAPKDYQLHQLNELAEVLAPRRIRRKVAASDIRGLVDYVNTYKLEQTHIYAGPADAPCLRANIDDHGEPHLDADEGVPSHCTHVAHYACPATHEWKTWLASNKKQMTQVQFAEFIQDNLRDIVLPSGADMLNMVTVFQDHSSAKMQSATNLKNGRVQIQFIEKEEVGSMAFPDLVKLGLPVFEGVVTDKGPVRYAVEARLRYRIKRDDDKGELVLWYELDRPDLAMRQAYDDLIDSVTRETEISVIRAL